MKTSVLHKEAIFQWRKDFISKVQLLTINYWIIVPDKRLSMMVFDKIYLIFSLDNMQSDVIEL